MTRRVIVTTAVHAFEGLDALVGDLPITLRRHPLQQHHLVNTETVRHALSDVSRWSGLLITSPRAAAALAGACREMTVPAGLRVWVSGAAAARPLQGLGLALEVGDGGDADMGAGASLALRIIGSAERGPLLYLAGDPHRPDLPARLADAGIVTETVIVYRSTVVDDVELMAVLARADLMVVGSPAVVTAIARQDDEAFHPGYVAVGATTGDACRAASLPLLSVAVRPTSAGIADAIRQALTLL